MYEGPIIEKPFVLSLYLKSFSASMPASFFQKSAPKTDVSTVDCFFENHYTHGMFRYIKKPPFNLQVTLYPAWSLSTNMWMLTTLPGDSEALTGTASLASL